MTAGDRYGRYEIVRLIGRGAMGDVYLATDTENGRRVALKIVYRGPEPEDLEILEAERLGAELQKRLGEVDRRVADVTRYGDLDGNLFIEMEYIEGEDLSMLLARNPLQPGFAVHIALELCDMLENLGRFTTDIGGRTFVGVVHGDLKPRNIRINAQNHVKVLDFGISKALSETRKYTMNVFASTAYSSPERIETQRIDAQSDLWSVGVLLYQMIAGKLPFDEPSKERLERRIRSSLLPDSLPASCPDPLRRIIFKMLAKDPARRYQSAAEVIYELTRYRHGQPVLAEEPENEATVRTTLPLDEPAEPDATVRTTVPVEDEDATFRTVTNPHVATSPKTTTPLGADYQPPKRRIRPAMGCFMVVAFLSVLLLGLTMWQMNYSQQASKFRTDLQAEKVTNLDQAWDQYQKLAAKTHLPFLLWGARSAMKQRLEAAADAVIAEYRNNDTPTVYEAQWKDAKENLGHALEIDPDDRGIKGRYRLCEGHLERIAAARARPAARQKLLNSAVNKFEEAAQLLKKSPDPYLGLARLYVYDLNDVEKAEDALKKAEDYGHPMGRREMAQLADGYRRRADRIWRESRGFSQMPDQEKDYLDKARQDYIHAQDLYARSGLFGDAARSQVLAIQGEQRVEQRLEDLRSGGVVSQ